MTPLGSGTHSIAQGHRMRPLVTSGDRKAKPTGSVPHWLPAPAKSSSTCPRCPPGPPGPLGSGSVPP